MVSATTKITIDNDILTQYITAYFKRHPKAHVVPITKPLPISINEWMSMTRFQIDTEKKRWTEFVEWVVDYYGIRDKHISSCTITVEYYFKTRIRHDLDNYTMKFIFDPLVGSGVLVDDSYFNVHELTYKAGHDKDNPRTVIIIKEKNDDGD
jgi:hypothetical protein